MPAAPLRHIDLNLLFAFNELAKARSVTAAAARLGITQPAMSRTLGRLRTTLGDPLFVRSARGLLPTPRALDLMPKVAVFLAQAQQLVEGPQGFEPSTAVRTFVVSTADYTEAVLLPPLLRRLAVEAPGVRLRITAPPLGLDQALEAGGVDLAWTPRQPSIRPIVWTKLFEESFSFMVRKGHPVLRQGPFTLEKFLSVRHLALAPVGRSNANPIDDRLARLGKERQVVASVPNFLVVPLLLHSNDLGATLPSRLVAALAQRFGLVSLPLPFEAHPFTMYQAWHERMRGDPAHAWFRQVVFQVSKSLARLEH
jgi:DNA-binding transcriptional LysR family regulator